MTRPDKVAAVDEVKQNLTGSAATLLTNYRGLTVTELAELRTELRKANASYKVVKNTLTRRAAADAGFEGLDEYLVGPTALVFCEEDPVGPAKALKAFQKDHPELVIKAGYLDGAVLDEAETIRLASLESREELIAKLAGLMYGALANFARLLQAPITEQARLMAALIEDGGVESKGFSPEGATEADATETDAPAPLEAATEAVESAAEATAEAVETVAEKAADAVESAAESVADAADSVAEAVSSDEDAAADGEDA